MFTPATIKLVHDSVLGPVKAGQVHNVPARVALAIQTDELTSEQVLAAPDLESLTDLANAANARHNAAVLAR